MISVNHLTKKIVINRTKYTNEQALLLQCFNINPYISPVINIDPRHLSNRACYFLIKNLYPELYCNPSSDETKKLYSDLKDLYSYYFNHFDSILKKKLWYYDNLFKHQKDGMFFSSYRKVSQTSFEQGLGKTITSISDSIIHNFETTIIIAPVTPMWNWYEDLTDQNKSDYDIKWNFDINWFTVINSKKKIIGSNQKFVLINYEIVGKNLEELVALKPAHIIIDECHKIKNRDSKRTKSVVALCKRTNAKVSLLSGTPAPNKVIDYYMYLNIANHPFGRNYRYFLDTFTTYIKDKRYGIQITGAKNIEVLNEAISNFIIRKVKANCLDLPGKRYIRVNFEFDDYREEYDRYLADFILNRKNSESDGFALHSLNKIIAKAKVKQCCEFAENILGDEDTTIVNGKEITRKKKVIIFCTYKEPIAMLKEYFKDRCVVLDGTVPTDKRMSLVSAFKLNPAVEVFIGQTASAAESLNLTNVSDVIFLNFTLTKSELDQLTDRADRIGQNFKVNVYLTVCKGSIDEKLYSLIMKKHADTSKLIDGESQVINPEDVNIKSIISELKLQVA